jgi:hypothetical protein
MAPRAGEQQPASSSKPQQRCCLGMLYYSQALQAEGQKPVRRGVACSRRAATAPRTFR